MPAPLTLEARHSLLACVLITEADEGFLDGILWPKRLAVGLGSWKL